MNLLFFKTGIQSSVHWNYQYTSVDLQKWNVQCNVARMTRHGGQVVNQISLYIL